jgi:cardiolipin synthase
MFSVEANTTCQWLCAGDEIFPAMLAAIEAARSSVCLETYIYSAGGLGERFREALVGAQQRGARVRVLVDALGSMGLPGNFWEPLRKAGGEARQFNPLALNRFWIRNQNLPDGPENGGGPSESFGRRQRHWQKR